MSKPALSRMRGLAPPPKGQRKEKIDSDELPQSTLTRAMRGRGMMTVHLNIYLLYKSWPQGSSAITGSQALGDESELVQL